ncbi:unknown protein [Simkania negevensis Z]|uniref:Uncharacterized protein n=1 Tax=Simkania negevensis (strain ATCC VR-1471 / DSM 27360 / Z) TaxID=331113 RepID=F8L634_SIMNZ|nr:unknown protein [Simkania negevensis Z]
MLIQAQPTLFIFVSKKIKLSMIMGTIFALKDLFALLLKNWQGDPQNAGTFVKDDLQNSPPHPH